MINLKSENEASTSYLISLLAPSIYFDRLPVSCCFKFQLYQLSSQASQCTKLTKLLQSLKIKQVSLLLTCSGVFVAKFSIFFLCLYLWTETKGTSILHYSHHSDGVIKGPGFAPSALLFQLNFYHSYDIIGPYVRSHALPQVKDASWIYNTSNSWWFLSSNKDNKTAGQDFLVTD